MGRCYTGSMDVLREFQELMQYVPWRILVILIVAGLLQRLIRVAVRRVVRRLVKRNQHPANKKLSEIDTEKREATVSSIFSTALIVVMWVIVGIIVLGELNIDIAALATGAGLAGIIIGFGAQNVIKDYLAGIFVILEDQYRVGDIVMFEGTGSAQPLSGVVEHITIRMTQLRDLDGNLHTVLNSSPTSVKNMSYKYANAHINLAVAYSSDIDKVEQVINQVGEELSEDEAFKDDTVEPIQFLRVDSFEDSAVIVKCLGKAAPATQWAMMGEFRRRIKKAFEKAGIEMPYNRVVIEPEKSS